MILSQSVLHDGLRFLLKDFFKNVMAKLGVAHGQLSSNNWRIMTAFYIGCHAKGKKEYLDASAYLHCYYIQAGRTSGQFYLSPFNGFRLVDNVKENAKDRNLFFKVTYVGNSRLCFKRKWMRPVRTCFVDADLRPTEVERVADLHATFCGIWKYIDGGITRDPVVMHEYFGDNLVHNICIY